MNEVILPIAIFVIVYVLISFELVNKVVAALLGVATILMLHIIDEHTAMSLVNTETLMLLLGMMVIVGILRKSGFFSLIAVKIAELTNGSPLKILLFFAIITGVLSAFLDNVTTILIIIPIVIELTIGMGLDPKIYVIAMALISNIGGTATLIGDPPNILIGSKVGLTFNQFIANLIIPVILAGTLGLLYLWFTDRKSFQPIDKDLVKLFSVQLLMEKIKHEFLSIKIDKVFLGKCLGMLILTILLFVTQTITSLSPGVVALSSAMILFIITKSNVEKTLEEVEWSTLLFFVGLFIIVGTLEHVGVLEWIAHNVFIRAGTNPFVLTLLVLWVSGIVSGFLDNIPFAIVMIPIITIINQATPVPNNILWWALSLGVCFGGNLTMIGASANIVSVGIAKRHGIHISFLDFMKKGLPVTLIALICSSAYLMIYLWVSL